MEEQGPGVAVPDDILVSGLPVEIFTEFDVNMDNVVEIDTEGEATGKVPSTPVRLTASSATLTSTRDLSYIQ